MTLTNFTARSVLETMACTWEKVKTMDILETKLKEIKDLFFSITSEPMNVKFYLKPSCIGRMKFCW